MPVVPLLQNPNCTEAPYEIRQFYPLLAGGVALEASKSSRVHL
jgi:hypothetical protein